MTRTHYLILLAFAVAAYFSSFNGKAVKLILPRK
jgi:hypothetical protein